MGASAPGGGASGSVTGRLVIDGGPDLEFLYRPVDLRRVLHPAIFGEPEPAHAPAVRLVASRETIDIEASVGAEFLSLLPAFEEAVSQGRLVIVRLSVREAIGRIDRLSLEEAFDPELHAREARIAFSLVPAGQVLPGDPGWPFYAAYFGLEPSGVVSEHSPSRDP